MKEDYKTEVEKLRAEIEALTSDNKQKASSITEDTEALKEL